MIYNSNYPPMMQSEYNNAPWNQEETEDINAVVSYCISFPIRLTVPKGLDDNYVLQDYYKEQYYSLEDIFKYLQFHFNTSMGAMSHAIKTLATNATVDNMEIEFA